MASRCHANQSGGGLQCRAPAIWDNAVCRMHRARGGAPRGNQNALKRGEFAAERLALTKEVASLTRIARETLAEIK
jgi:uncharacterized protein YjcR